MNKDTGAPDLPANAKPGECFARVLVAPVYKTSTEEVLKSAASEKIEVIPAKYITETEKVQIKETSETAELIPAQYEWIEEKILVKEASENGKINYSRRVCDPKGDFTGPKGTDCNPGTIRNHHQAGKSNR